MAGAEFETRIDAHASLSTMGAYLITIQYDPTVLEITDISPALESEFASATFVDATSFQSGATRVAAYQTTAADPSASSSSLLVVRWLVVGAPGAQSGIELEIEDLLDFELGPVDATTTGVRIFVGLSTPTPSVTPQTVSPVPATPTATPLPMIPCPGDCDASGMVDIAELLFGVNMSLGTASLEDCAGFDVNGDARVTVDEIIRAVQAALRGCPPGSPFVAPYATYALKTQAAGSSAA
jgi:hypothetical protein